MRWRGCGRGCREDSGHDSAATGIPVRAVQLMSGAWRPGRRLATSAPFLRRRVAGRGRVGVDGSDFGTPAADDHPSVSDDGAEKLRRLQSVTDAALSSLELDDLLAELLDRTRELLDAATAVIKLL